MYIYVHVLEKTHVVEGDIWMCILHDGKRENSEIQLAVQGHNEVMN